MRFIYKILIGLIIFNSMLVFLAGFFAIQGTPPVESGYGKNISSDPTFTSYEITSNPIEILTGGDAVVILGISLGIGAALSWAIKSPVPIAAMLFGGFIATLYYNTISIIDNIISPYNNWILVGIVTVVGIVIAIIAAFTIIEIFAGQTGADQ